MQKDIGIVPEGSLVKCSEDGKATISIILSADSDHLVSFSDSQPLHVTANVIAAVSQLLFTVDFVEVCAA